MTVEDEQVLRIDALPEPTDPLRENFQDGSEVACC